MNNLEQIAKQIGLLSRLVELLRMQEEPEKLWERECQAVVLLCESENDPSEEVNTKGLSPIEQWNHPITQKAWGDELVKAAKELIKPFNFTNEEIAKALDVCKMDRFDSRIGYPFANPCGPGTYTVDTWAEAEMHVETRLLATNLFLFKLEDCERRRILRIITLILCKYGRSLDE